MQFAFSPKQCSVSRAAGLFEHAAFSATRMEKKGQYKRRYHRLNRADNLFKLAILQLSGLSSPSVVKFEKVGVLGAWMIVHSNGRRYGIVCDISMDSETDAIITTKKLGVKSRMVGFIGLPAFV